MLRTLQPFIQNRTNGDYTKGMFSYSTPEIMKSTRKRQITVKHKIYYLLMEYFFFVKGQ